MADLGQQIRMAVANGDITAEQGRGRMARARKRMATPQQNVDSRRITAEGLRRRLAAGVDSGRITEEDAGKRYRAWEESQSDQDAPRRTISRADYAAAAEKMKAMVASGEITEEQMNARLNRMRLMIGRDRGAAPEGSSRQLATAAINDTCPVSGKKVGDDAPTVELHGRKVAFCCEVCVAKFNENPRTFLGALRKANP